MPETVPHPQEDQGVLKLDLRGGPIFPLASVWNIEWQDHFAFEQVKGRYIGLWLALLRFNDAVLFKYHRLGYCKFLS